MPTHVSDPEAELDPFAAQAAAPDVAEPTHAPAEPARGSLIPRWQDGPQHDLTADEPEPDVDPEPEPVEAAVPPTQDDVEDEPREVVRKAKPKRRTKAPDPAPVAVDDQADEEAEPPRRWDPRGNGKHNRLTYWETPPKQSAITAWHSISRPTRWLAYNGVALAGGWYLGLPQWVTAQTAYLVSVHHTWADPMYAIWGACVVGLMQLDCQTRIWWPPLALVTRVPMASVVAGVLLYGNPAGGPA